MKRWSISKFVILSVILSIGFFAPCPSYAVPIYQLTDLRAASVCFELGGGSLECSGLTQAQLAAQPDSLIQISFPQRVIKGGLSDAAGNLGGGDEFLRIDFSPGLPPTSGNFLHSVFLSFNPTGRELSSGITTDMRVFGFSGDSLSGFAVFSFNSSAPTIAPIPEPSTILLFGTGLAALAGWRYRKRANA